MILVPSSSMASWGVRRKAQQDQQLVQKQEMQEPIMYVLSGYTLYRISF